MKIDMNTITELVAANEQGGTVRFVTGTSITFRERTPRFGGFDE